MVIIKVSYLTALNDWWKTVLNFLQCTFFPIGDILEMNMYVTFIFLNLGLDGDGNDCLGRS